MSWRYIVRRVSGGTQCSPNDVHAWLDWLHFDGANSIKDHHVVKSKGESKSGRFLDQWGRSNKVRSQTPFSVYI